MATNDRTCSFEGCTRGLRSRGYCDSHYAQLRRGKTLTPITHPFKPRFTLAETIERHHERRGTCTVWTSEVDPAGYPHYRRDGQYVRVHREVWKAAHGPIPDGLQVDHMCHTPRCVNVEHLQLATRKEQKENAAGIQTNNRSGYRGVHWNGQGKNWRGLVSHNKRKYFAGDFQDPEDAHRAVIALRLELYTNNLVDRGINIPRPGR